MEIIPRIGQQLRLQFHWVPAHKPIYLVMDNAGGHGTNDAKASYADILLASNVYIIWQPPRSPELNMLDLGIWMSIQSAVTKQHFLCRNHVDALAKSVVSAWSWRLHSQAFLNVWQRLKVVLTCIIDDRGGNRLVEERRGKLLQNIDITDNNHETIGNLNNNSAIAPVIDLVDDESFDNVDLDALSDTN